MVFASQQRIIQREKDESFDNKNQMKESFFFFFTFLNSRETDHSLCFPGEWKIKHHRTPTKLVFRFGDMYLVKSV